MSLDLDAIKARCSQEAANGWQTCASIRIDTLLELVAEIERLRAQRVLDNEDFSRAFDLGLAAGERRERADVVAWLRQEIQKCGCDDDTAACIERGEHRREEEP
jgi:hypothetical protein